MSKLDPTALKALLELVRAQNPRPDTMTLAEAEAAVVDVFRQLGPELLQATLNADKPDAEEVKKGHHLFVAKKRCASADGENER